MSNRTTAYVLFLVFVFLLLNVRQEHMNQDKIKEEITHLEAERAILANMTYGEDRANKTKEPEIVKEQINKLFNDIKPNRYYSNLSAIFKGPWEYNGLGEINETRRGHFNYDEGGTMLLDLDSEPSLDKNDGAFVQGTLKLYNERESENTAFFWVEGWHVVSNGSLILQGSPNRDLTLFKLLDLARNNDSFTWLKPMIDAKYEKRLNFLHRLLEIGGYNGNNELSSVNSHCDLQLYLQLLPIPPEVDMSGVKEWERELQSPTGIPVLSSPPVLSTNMLMYSRNCSFLLAAEQAEGLQQELYNRKALRFAALATVTSFIQVYFTVQQMEFTQTPSSVSKLAVWMLALQILIDGYTSVLLITTSMVFERLFLPFVAASFFTFVLVSVFELRYLRMIWRVQQAERGPVSEETIFENVYTRLYLLAILGLLVYWIAGNRTRQLQILLVVLTILYSFWLPQIWRNLYRGSHKALLKKYIIGQSLLRLVLPLYFFACPASFVSQFTSAAPYMPYLVGYVAVQVMVLLLQDQLGPRFFFPSRFLPATYNYHPVISIPDLEQAPNASSDCAVCMNEVNVESRNGLVLSRGNYMVTPCHHIFHTPCLEQWMRIKLECPVCRSALPPI